MKFVMFRAVTDHARSVLHHVLDWLLRQVLWRAFRQHRPFTPLLSCLCLTSLITSLKLWFIVNSTVHFAGFGWTEYTSCMLCREQSQCGDAIYTQASPGKRAKTSRLWRTTRYRLILRKEHAAWFLRFPFSFTACMFADVFLYVMFVDDLLERVVISHACVMMYPCASLYRPPSASPCSALRPASWSLFPPCACWYSPSTPHWSTLHTANSLSLSLPLSRKWFTLPNVSPIPVIFGQTVYIHPKLSILLKMNQITHEPILFTCSI